MTRNSAVFTNGMIFLRRKSARSLTFHRSSGVCFHTWPTIRNGTRQSSCPKPGRLRWLFPISLASGMLSRKQILLHRSATPYFWAYCTLHIIFECVWGVSWRRILSLEVIQYKMLEFQLWTQWLHHYSILSYFFQFRVFGVEDIVFILFLM